MMGRAWSLLLYPFELPLPLPFVVDPLEWPLEVEEPFDERGLCHALDARRERLDIVVGDVE